MIDWVEQSKGAAGLGIQYRTEKKGEAVVCSTPPTSHRPRLLCDRCTRKDSTRNRVGIRVGPDQDKVKVVW